MVAVKVTLVREVVPTPTEAVVLDRPVLVREPLLVVLPAHQVQRQSAHKAQQPSHQLRDQVDSQSTAVPRQAAVSVIPPPEGVEVVFSEVREADQVERNQTEPEQRAEHTGLMLQHLTRAEVPVGRGLTEVLALPVQTETVMRRAVRVVREVGPAQPVTEAQVATEAPREEAAEAEAERKLPTREAQAAPADAVKSECGCGSRWQSKSQ